MNRCRFTHVRKCPDDGRHLGLQKAPHHHGGASEAALAARLERLVRKRSAGEAGATGVSEVRLVRERREQYTARQPVAVHRSGSNVVKRSAHRSPDFECKLVNPGRGVSLEEMPVAHEARVLVVESSRKQKSVVRIFARASE
jgi:hypothetical protein